MNLMGGRFSAIIVVSYVCGLRGFVEVVGGYLFVLDHAVDAFNEFGYAVAAFDDVQDPLKVLLGCLTQEEFVFAFAEVFDDIVEEECVGNGFGQFGIHAREYGEDLRVIRGSADQIADIAEGCSCAVLVGVGSDEIEYLIPVFVFFAEEVFFGRMSVMAQGIEMAGKDDVLHDGLVGIEFGADGVFEAEGLFEDFFADGIHVDIEWRGEEEAVVGCLAVDNKKQFGLADVLYHLGGAFVFELDGNFIEVGIVIDA